MITILGPTATGKTTLAVHIANQLNGEIISADSRQVYRGMDIGTGKDIGEYNLEGRIIPYHLIDMVDPGYEYNVFEYQRDFIKAYNSITDRNKTPVLCGGTGMYLEAVLKGYKLIDVPENKTLREKLINKSVDELTDLLKSYKAPHNITDTSDKTRLIRAIEIQQFYSKSKDLDLNFPKIKNTIFGIHYDRDIIRSRITGRLKARLNEGMIDEVKNLIDSGVPAGKLIFYGLEYKFITKYLLGDLTYEQMSSLLNTAIHQFAKRQVTWFRRMKKQGVKIHWIEGVLPIQEKVKSVMSFLE